MKRALSVLVAALLTVIALSVPANASTVPDEFEADWDNPTSAAPPLQTPDTKSCQVDLIDHQFADDSPATGDFTPPSDCGDQWSRVVLTMEGAVAGDQDPRIAELEIAGVPVFAAATPQPSPEGISWDVERDITKYAPLLSEEQSFAMGLDNTVDAENTGVFDIQLSLTFYADDGAASGPETADQVMPIDNAEQSASGMTGQVELPRNSQRLVADVYASAPTSGCEAQWYLATDSGDEDSCGAKGGAYREVQVFVDGNLAGVAAPAPQVYSSGWSNPYLWANLPAPDTAAISPISFDLTPHLGALNDGEAHDVSLKVAGSGEAEWSLPTGLRVWQDSDAEVVEGGLLSNDVTDAQHDVSANGDSWDTQAGRTHSATGWLSTSQGTVLTTVERSVSLTAERSRTRGSDTLDAHFGDTQTRSMLDGDEQLTEIQLSREYAMEGTNKLDADGTRDTSVTLTADRSKNLHTPDGDKSLRTSEEFSGEASFQSDAPRSAHHATATTQQRYRVFGDQPCYDHTVSTRNGTVTKDTFRCGSTTVKPRDD